MDPFRLPRALRDVAFAGRGHDLDDSASYPRALLALASMSFNRESGREHDRVNSPGYSSPTVSRSSPRWDSFFSGPIP